MIILTSNPKVKADSMAAFEQKFDQFPESSDESFLSVAFRRDGHKIHLNVPKLWRSLENLLTKHKLPKARGAPLPDNALERLAQSEADANGDNPIIDKSECDIRAILGTAMWGVYAVRPAEVFAVAALARDPHLPTKNVCDILLRLCAYLIEHANDERTIDPDKERTPDTFVDSSWGNEPQTQRSFYGFCTVVIIFTELGFTNESKFIIPEQPDQLGPPYPLYVDNANSDRLHRDSRHNALRIAWIRDMVSNSLIAVRKIATTTHVSDVFTKVLAPAEHRRFRCVLMGAASTATLGFAMCVFGA